MTVVSHWKMKFIGAESWSEEREIRGLLCLPQHRSQRVRGRGAATGAHESGVSLC